MFQYLSQFTYCRDRGVFVCVLPFLIGLVFLVICHLGVACILPFRYIVEATLFESYERHIPTSNLYCL